MQLAIISGKGGTGKTTIVSSFAYLAGSEAIKVDCDVDASNLHLMFEGKDIDQIDFFGSKKATINPEQCINCGRCVEVCRFDAIDAFETHHEVNEIRCEGCGACQIACPAQAIDLGDEYSGIQILSQLKDQSYLSRAELFPGADGSGKLVSQIRKKAQSLNMFKDNLILIDGSPGIGCPVMASITGVDYGLIVTEPTQSGFEDFLRVYELSQHFGVKTYVLINKFDINCNMTEIIVNYCQKEAIPVVGKIPYDAMVNQSNFESKPLVLYNESRAGQAIMAAWSLMKKEMEGS